MAGSALKPLWIRRVSCSRTLAQKPDHQFWNHIWRLLNFETSSWSDSSKGMGNPSWENALMGQTERWCLTRATRNKQGLPLSNWYEQHFRLQNTSCLFCQKPDAKDDAHTLKGQERTPRLMEMTSDTSKRGFKTLGLPNQRRPATWACMSLENATGGASYEISKNVRVCGDKPTLDETRWKAWTNQA